MSSSNSPSNKPEQFAPPGAAPTTPEELAALPHDNGAAKLNGAVWTLTAIAGTFLALRIYCKFLRHKGLWWDDIILIAAWVCITIECALLTVMTSLGYGLHIWDFDLNNMSRLLVIVNVAGSFSVTAAIWSKTSFAFTLLRLTDGWIKVFIWFIIVSMNIAMGLSALFPWVTCTPVQMAWDLTVTGTCWNPSVLVNYNIFSAAYSAAMDITLALLPWKIIWQLQMRQKERIGVAVAMSMGIFAGITGIVKTSKIPLMLSADFADGVDLFIWGNAESTITIIAASIPILRVLIRDVTNSRRYYRSDFTHRGTMSKLTGGSTGRQSHTLVVTISAGGPLNSHPDSGRKTHDDGSDKSILNNTGAGIEHSRVAAALARYDSIGVKPPPKQDNRRRFKVFIDRINRREWAYFHDGIQPTLMYNRTEMTLYDFTQLLKYEFGPKSNAHIEMCTVVGGKDDDEGPVAARMRVKTTVLTNSGLLMSSAQRKKFEYARHMVVYFSDKKICEISDLSDEDAKSRQPSRVLGLPGLRPPPPPLPIDMQQFYADYIACINATKGGEEVQKFCKQAGVVHNGARLALDRYCRLMSSAFDAIEDLQFVAHTVLHDEVRQLLAVRIDFTGTPVRPFGGGIPNGKTVVFSELVFYWLENGKISDVLSIVDWAGYRTQLIY
ncbi:hypothetical protein B0H66DRAFT_578817 [Apodospora peruviana]|uniref:Rhodopsin domain-containing protein n=1 Tax=Apodospora peruviana TaxID=516989 RepID=A0AAE0IP36_9PEZI|nr:hypothetical protein B0H66DRAFT_578817 [Apodospora peruviana]